MTNRVALITGGSRGIGAATARRLAADGFDIALTYVAQASKAQEVARVIQEMGRKAFAIRADVSKVEETLHAVRETVTRLGRLDVLVNNAGINIRKPPHTLTLAEWRRVIDTNLTSAYLCSHAAHPEMKRAGGGKIINIGSMMSIFGAPYAPAYAASKGGIVQFTKACAAAWAPHNIQVNAILPGWIDTELTRNAREQVAGLHDSVLRRTPAGRWGTIDDFRGIAAFLAAPASDFITGATITVDGGYSILG